MKEADDNDKYRKVLDYYTNDESSEFDTGSGKFLNLFTSGGTSNKDCMINFLFSKLVVQH